MATEMAGIRSTALEKEIEDRAERIYMKKLETCTGKIRGALEEFAGGKIDYEQIQQFSRALGADGILSEDCGRLYRNSINKNSFRAFAILRTMSEGRAGGRLSIPQAMRDDGEAEVLKTIVKEVVDSWEKQWKF
ncbi:MAG: hypothetical protein J7M24_00165 [Candidatus Latescibacteria bacterium]|nr:hypothetical protein [Candidatus Latescibacterota bacterium]